MIPSHDILNYIPHRPPFVMIDEISIDSSAVAHSTFLISEENVLAADGYFSESGIIENMAQTAGAATGLKAGASGDAPGLGYIGALKNLRVMALPRIGETIKTEIIFVHQVMNALMVEGTVYCNGNIVATCELKIFILN